MALCCTVCGCWYDRPGRDTLDICEPCYQANFARAELPLDWAAPGARETLEAYVDSSRQLTLTPRQVDAMRRMHERWAARSDAARAQWEETP